VAENPEPGIYFVKDVARPLARVRAYTFKCKWNGPARKSGRTVTVGSVEWQRPGR